MKDGGSAFPVLDAKFGYDGENLGLGCDQSGMTLRDWFAGQALIGLASNWRSFTDDNALELLGKSAYVCADAMLAARESKQ